MLAMIRHQHHPWFIPSISTINEHQNQWKPIAASHGCNILTPPLINHHPMHPISLLVIKDMATACAAIGALAQPLVHPLHLCHQWTLKSTENNCLKLLMLQSHPTTHQLSSQRTPNLLTTYQRHGNILQRCRGIDGKVVANSCFDSDFNHPCF